MTTAKKPAKRACTRCGKPNAIPPARLCPTCKRASKKKSSETRHEAHVGDTYGLLPGEYKKILNAQGGVCYICRGKGGGKWLAVDHDHSKTGRKSVRAILCNSCNHILLGRILRDDPARAAEMMQRAIEVLTDAPAQKILGD